MAVPITRGVEVAVLSTGNMGAHGGVLPACPRRHAREERYGETSALLPSPQQRPKHPLNEPRHAARDALERRELTSPRSPSRPSRFAAARSLRLPVADPASPVALLLPTSALPPPGCGAQHRPSLKPATSYGACAVLARIPRPAKPTLGRWARRLLRVILRSPCRRISLTRPHAGGGLACVTGGVRPGRARGCLSGDAARFSGVVSGRRG